MGKRADSAVQNAIYSGGRKLRVCFVLSYREPDYIRGKSICEALASSGEVELLRAVNQSRGIRRYWETVRALREAKHTFRPDVYILGFRGHEIALPVRWMTRGRPLILDALMSPYAALAEEMKFGATGRALAPVWRVFEAAALNSADAILTDTKLHSQFLESEFGVSAQKLVACPVGAMSVDCVRSKSPAEPMDETFSVLFFGSFLPLHGIGTIVAAASRLRDLDIRFDFVGGSDAQARSLQQQCHSMGVSNYTHRKWVSFQRLLSHDIPCATLCLGGPFGATPQALRVVTGKSSQCLALGKPTIIGRIDEENGFIDRVNCLLVEQGDALALADAIRWAYRHRGELAGIGRRGQELYAQRMSATRIAECLLPLVKRLSHAANLGRVA